MLSHRTRRRRIRAGSEPSLSLDHDRRSAPRHPAEGEVILVPAASGAEFRGTLKDISANGFRVAHFQAQLLSGQELLFWHSNLEGRARVVWTRILGQEIESGFLVLESGPLQVH